MVAMAHRYERPTVALPIDWEGIGRLVREETLASMAKHIESLVLLFEPHEWSDPGVSESGGARS